MLLQQWYVCVGICFLSSACRSDRMLLCVRVCEGVRVICIVLSSPCCIHRPSHRSMYWWGCNYVPQWSSLCFFTAQELSRQRSVCAPWKLPAENHMAMRAIMDFSPPLRTLLSPPYSFSQCFLLLSMNIWADVNRCVLPAATSVFVLQQPHKLSPLYSLILEIHADTVVHTYTLRHSERAVNQRETMPKKAIVRRCFITSEDYLRNCVSSGGIEHILYIMFSYSPTQDCINQVKALVQPIHCSF